MQLALHLMPVGSARIFMTIVVSVITKFLVILMMIMMFFQEPMVLQVTLHLDVSTTTIAV